MKKPTRNRLIVALDFSSLQSALPMARRLAEWAGMFKVGNQLFSAEGPRAVEELATLGRGIFLDLKFHDIPNTVAGAVAGVARLPGLRLINLHTMGGLEMMRAAARALRLAMRGRAERPRLLGVTILTSLSAADMRQVGIAGKRMSRAVALARLAQRAGVDGVVASAHEVRAIRRALGRDFLIVVPGVRPRGRVVGGLALRRAEDQKRVATPAQAILAGADYIVVGRPITAAADPRKAAAAILEEIARAEQG